MTTILMACLADDQVNDLQAILPAVFQNNFRSLVAPAPSDIEPIIEVEVIDAILIPNDPRLFQRLQGFSLDIAVVVINSDGGFGISEEIIAQGAQDVIDWATATPDTIGRTLKHAMHRQNNLNEVHSFVRLEREISQRLDMTQTLSLATDAIMRRTGAKSCVVAWIHPSTRVLQVLAKFGRPAFVPDTLPEHLLTNQQGTLGKIFSPRAQKLVMEIPERRMILTLDGREARQGFISIEGMPHMMPTPDQLRFLKYVSSRVSIVIQKIFTHQMAEYHARQMKKLYEASIAMISTNSMEDLMDVGAWGISNLLETAGAMAALYDPQRHVLTVQGIQGTHDILSYAPAVNSDIAMSQYPHIMAALGEHRTIQRAMPDLSDDVLGEMQLASPHLAMLIPMPVEGGLLGLLGVFTEDNYKYFSDNEIALSQSFALQLVGAAKQVQLYENVKELEQIKSEMIQRASHDLKNPIHVIGGYFELLSESIPEPDELQQMAIDAINGGLNTMSQLVEDILSLERIESQTVETFAEVEIVTMLQEVYEELQRQAKLKQQNMTIDLRVQECRVLGNSMQLRQVLHNLINNAIKYTPTAGTVKVRATHYEGEFYFEVEDTGYGIPSERQARLFERFYRAQTPGTEEIKGTGLGLYLVKQVVERHRGQIWFESTEGVGSTFGFNIPVVAVLNT